jgi:hypothetical protein
VKTDQAFMFVGFACACAGVWVIWGLGAALVTGGLVLFVAGGLASREQRTR